MGLALVLGHRVVVGDGTGCVERASAGAHHCRRPNSGDEEMVVSDAPSDEKAPGHGWT